MKKFLRISIILMFLLLISTNVQAATPEEFIAYVTRSINLNGQTVTLITSAQKVEIERYLAKNKIPESELDYLKGKFDEGVEVVRKAGVTSFQQLSKEDKQELVELANEASSETGIQINIHSDGFVDIYNLDGTLFVTENPNIIKQTGFESYIYIPAIASIAIVIAVASVRKLKYAK